MNKNSREIWVIIAALAAFVILGQLASYFLAPASWAAFLQRLPVILSMIAFWVPIITLLTTLIVWGVLRFLGFESLQAIRNEMVEQNNPAPAILYIGAVIAAVLLFSIVIRP